MNPPLKPVPPAVAKAEVQIDELHQELRHTIRLCWKSYAGLKLFKKLTDQTIGEQVEQINMVRALDLQDRDPRVRAKADELATPEKVLTFPMICGQSASILCELLTGNPMNDSAKPPKPFKLSEREKLLDALDWMHLTEGYVLVRFDTNKNPAGHAFIFLSTQHKANKDLYGFIYQTNIGLFDLDAWINDPRSVTSIRFENYLVRLVKGFRKDPVKAYRDPS